MGHDGIRVVLSLAFKAILGIPRIFHFETLDDPGFAILSGGTKVLTRHKLGSLVRRVPLVGVRRLMRSTAPALKQATSHTISIDEHAIARFTRKFSIRKGYHTIRNKHMKIEKLTFAFHTGTRQLLSLLATRGHVSLKTIAEKLLPSLRRRAQGRQIRLVLDAGAAKSHGQLFELADYPRQVTIVRVPRRAPYLKHWEQIPPQQWREVHEKGPYSNAPPKVVHVADTVMLLRDPKTKIERLARTIIVREKTRRGKDRWHGLWIFGDEHSDRWQLVQEFRTRQHHEQTYRIMLHDAYVDTASSGYDKNSPNPNKPGFKQNAITLYGWTAGLATHALQSLAETLPSGFRRAHPRTLRRWFLNTPAALFLGNDTLIVALQPRRNCDLWHNLIAPINQASYRIPWLEHRRLVLSLDRDALVARRKMELIRGGRP